MSRDKLYTENIEVVFCRRGRCGGIQSTSRQNDEGTFTVNDKEYTGRNFYKTYFHLPLALNCAQVVFFEQNVYWTLNIEELARKLSVLVG